MRSYTVLAWIKAFLFNCSQCGHVSDHLSTLINIISQVLQRQRSVLRAILFILYINDISDICMGSTVTIKLYANEAKLYSCMHCANDMHYLQLCLNFVISLQWFCNQCTHACAHEHTWLRAHTHLHTTHLFCSRATLSYRLNG